MKYTVKELAEAFKNFVGDNELGEKEGQTQEDIELKENKVQKLNKPFKTINEVSQDKADEVNAKRQLDAVKKTMQYKKTNSKEDQEIAKEAKDKATKSNKLLDKWEKGKAEREAKAKKKK